MNAQEIQALIDAKIKGQGSAIDIGGALPAILGGLNEMASKAISPDSTDLDEETQMQVRKNLGLYYEEPEVDNTVQYDGDPTGKEIYEGKVRLSEDAPDDGDLLSVKKNGEEVQYSVEEYGNYYLIIDGLTNAFAVVFKEKEGEYDLDIPIGVYGYVDNPEYSLEYKVKDSEVNKIDEKYLPDMPSGDGVFLVNVAFDMTSFAYKADKTYAEIVAAIEGGNVVMANMSNMVLALNTYYADYPIVFAGVGAGAQTLQKVTIGSDEAVAVDSYNIPSSVEIGDGAGSINHEGNPLIELTSTASKYLTLLLNGRAKLDSAGLSVTWTAEKLSGEATISVSDSILSVSAAASGITQLIVTGAYTKQDLLSTKTYKISSLVTIKATIE